jgi:hypothetical protein
MRVDEPVIFGAKFDDLFHILIVDRRDEDLNSFFSLHRIYPHVELFQSNGFSTARQRGLIDAWDA